MRTLTQLLLCFGIALHAIGTQAQIFVDSKPIPEGIEFITVDLYGVVGGLMKYRMWVETDELSGNICDATGGLVTQRTPSGVFNYLHMNGWEYVGPFSFNTYMGKGILAQSVNSLSGTLFRRKR